MRVDIIYGKKGKCKEITWECPLNVNEEIALLKTILKETGLKLTHSFDDDKK